MITTWLTRVLAVIFVSVLCWLGFLLRVSDREVLRLNYTVAKLQSDVAKRDVLIQTQNSSVIALKAEYVAKADRAARALVEAKKNASRNTDLATSVLSRSPTGPDDCSATRTLLEEAIGR